MKGTSEKMDISEDGSEQYFSGPDENATLLLETSSGEKVYRHLDSIIVSLPDGRSTITTSWVNGGYREDLRAIFNHKVSKAVKGSKDLEGGNVSAYLEIVSRDLGLNPAYSSGLLTAARMENVAIVTRSFRGVEVTGIVTGGIEVNGGRVGDPASYYQENGSHMFIQGTINTILLIGADLPAYAMNRAIVTASEAKAAALQQLMAPSRYSNGIATGSGTDMIAIVADRNSSVHLTDSGKHSKLGELIGLTVIEATQKALELQSELSPINQRDMMVRLERFGIDEAAYWNVASRLEGENRKSRFFRDLRDISRNPFLVGSTCSVLHLLDEISWGLIPETSGRKVAISIMKGLPEMLKSKNEVPFDSLLDEKDSILDNWLRVSSWLIKNGNCQSTDECSESRK
ncbi:adenosylcobinamide amidohydrolase [Methanolobus sp. ZRKC3]|uniref:adenosylcobinamide amidohydrolase n=1 Tax=Methanolobus sp. ZRKC3 TaxID=3125786 RepID=UPI003248DCF1